MKTQSIFGLILASLISISTYAQDVPRVMEKQKHRIETREKMEAMKTGYFTNKLDLDAKTAAKFWPVYNAHQKEMKALRRQHRSTMETAHNNWANLSDKEKEDLLQSRFDLQASELDLQRGYHKNFKEVLTLDRVAKLYKAEESFKKHLMQEMRTHRKEERGQRH
ncbi:MAG: hypothetical protein ACI8ZO_000511 [Flavobacteriales bacterium]|jgi:hypothetical protein